MKNVVLHNVYYNQNKVYVCKHCLYSNTELYAFALDAASNFLKKQQRDLSLYSGKCFQGPKVPSRYTKFLSRGALWAIVRRQNHTNNLLGAAGFEFVKHGGW